MSNLTRNTITSMEVAEMPNNFNHFTGKKKKFSKRRRKKRIKVKRQHRNKYRKEAS